MQCQKARIYQRLRSKNTGANTAKDKKNLSIQKYNTNTIDQNTLNILKLRKRVGQWWEKKKGKEGREEGKREEGRKEGENFKKFSAYCGAFCF